MAQKKSVTRVDVAREAGTSVAVVSYVINDGPRSVAPETRQRVLRAIETVGYRPNTIARALASGVSGAYGLIVPDVSNSFFATLAHRLEDAVARHDRVLLLGNSAESRERERQLLSMFTQWQIDGLLFVGVDGGQNLDPVLKAGLPVVMLDRVNEQQPVSSVAIDNVAAAKDATNHLIDHGYTRVGMVMGPPEVSTAGDRWAGWKDAMGDREIEIRKSWCIEAPFSRQGGFKAASIILESGDTPEALLASNEQQAVGILAAARTRGIDIPEDLAIITIDGTEDSQFTSPQLSTVVQPFEDIAASAIELLTGGGSPEVHKTYAHALKLGRSCGCRTGYPGEEVEVTA